MTAAVAAAPRRSAAVYVFGILAILVVVFAVAAAGFYALIHMQGQTSLPQTAQVEQVGEKDGSIVSAAFDQASKVSLRATADGWSEEASTPLIAYIKRVEDANPSSSSNSTSAPSDPSLTPMSAELDPEKADEGTEDDGQERYFAFSPNKNASLSLPSGRYTFSFITPLNSDGSLYTVPEMVDMVVGDGGMAVLPIDLVHVEASEVTEEQSSHALAQLKTAWERKKDASFDYGPYAKSIDLALNTWFSEKSDATEDESSADLTEEQQAALDAQANTQAEQSSEQSSSASSAPTATEHAHDWVAQHEQRWEPSIVPVIDTAAWESPVYARYKCQEGILFETLDECLAHVREHGNETYTSSNEIIRIDYHPAVVHYEERDSYVDVVSGYRCSICGATGTL